MSDGGAERRAGPGVTPAEVRQMFDRIAGRYDLMNRLITLGQDRRWRRLMVAEAALGPGGRLLDLGAGTGEVAREARRQHPDLALALAADLSPGMLRAGQQRPGSEGMAWSQLDALRLPFADASFDAVTSAYLARNVADPQQMFSEQLRVLRPGGRVVCLDTTPPAAGPMAPLVWLHMRAAIPLLGRLVAGDAAAYRYLPRTSRAFLRPGALAGVMTGAGFVEVRFQTLMLGTQALHVGQKRA
jgi:demethylmenaquinone methyltransferase/2-methoxy-6-polyprenyl-1,4-benzoquinol methylase